jgi:phosphate transport system substrate-binding protein
MTAKFRSDSVSLMFKRTCAYISVVAFVLAAACGGGQQGQQGGGSQQGAAAIRIDGSSTVYPITEAVAEEFKKGNPNVNVTVGVSGTGGGFQKFCRGETDISNASRPIRPTEIEACKNAGIEYIELPVAYDGLAVVVNPRNSWTTSMTVEELKKLWAPEAQGKVTRWSHVRSSWPDREIHLFGAGVDSGTYDYFTEAIVGKEGASRGDFTASEDDNVLVQGIASDPNALGFFGLAYYVENQDRLKAVPIQPPGGGAAVLPSVETARDGSYQPLSRPIFIYVSKQAADELEAVRQFVEFYLDPENAELLVEEVGYVPLPTKAYELALRNFEERETGTAFAGRSQVGVAVQELLAAERVD